MPKFSDVPDDGIHRDAIDKAATAGIIEGYPDGTFRPSKAVTRGQLASVLDELGLLDPEPV